MPRELNVMKIFVQGLCIKILHVSNYNIIPALIHDVKIVRFKIVGISWNLITLPEDSSLVIDKSR